MAASSLLDDQVTPSPERLWAVLQEALPDRFPADFRWACTCKVKGFPGCTDLGHFLNRVSIAVTDYHQMAETKDRGVPIQHDDLGRPIVLQVNAFSKARKEAYEGDMATVITTLVANGLPLLPEK